MLFASRSPFCALVVILLLGALPAAAQSSRISGVATDPQHAALAGQIVVLINVRTGARVTAHTDERGRYVFVVAAPDIYVVEMQVPGFERATSEPLSVRPAESVRHDVRLTLAGAATSVTVTATDGDDPAYETGVVSSLGAAGPALLLDTPHMISILPAALIANQQVRSFKEALKFLPVTEFQEMQGSEVLRPETRGMQGSNMQNTRLDGLAIVITGANSVESVEQIEVLNGLGAAMYGPANPSGMFNFVAKRPTEEPRRRLSLSYDSEGVGTIHADVGGRLGRTRRLGYRANLLAAEGEAFVSHSRLARRLVSLAVDARPFSGTVFEALYSYYNLLQRGFPGWFTYGRANNRSPFILLPADAPDAAREGYGQRDAGVELGTRIGQVRVKHTFNAGWHFGIGLLDQRVTRDISTQVNALTDNAGSYTASLAYGFAPRFAVRSNLAYLNGRVDTGAVSHEIALGTTGFAFRTFADVSNPTPSSVALGSASVASPMIFALPAGGIPRHEQLFLSSIVHQQGFNISDTARFDPHWSVRIAASQDWIWTDSFNSRGGRIHGRTNGISPSASVLYKPAARMTMYASYGSSLQQGDVAPTTVVNAGQPLPPYRSRQIEAGYKLTLPRVGLSIALFRLERPFATTNLENVFSVSGRQINDGAEATLTGHVARRLVLHGGLTVLDPQLTRTGNRQTDGKRFVGMPRIKSTLLAEYQLPVGAGTFVSCTWQAMGRRPIDDINSSWTRGFHVLDVGTRYAHRLTNRTIVWRVGVNNLTAVRYWSTLGPGNITGTNVGSYTGHLGSSRTVAVSLEVPF